MNQIQRILFFDPCDRIYAEHFPDAPTVPGSLIVHAFLECAKQYGIQDKNVVIENFKFRKFVSPGKYNCRMTAFEDRLECSLFQTDTKDKKPLATGIIRR